MIILVHKRTGQARLAPNKTYEITKFTIKEATSPPPGAGRLSTSNRNLRIKTVDARRNPVDQQLLGTGQIEWKLPNLTQLRSKRLLEIKKFHFLKLKLNLSIKRATNFSQDDNTDADGRSATLEFTFNKHFLQIPKVLQQLLLFVQMLLQRLHQQALLPEPVQIKQKLALFPKLNMTQPMEE
ncbi:hypothetical protein [Mesomycoplasma ovipneumoniae]|uniref:hypothetical protein n=1 Tax=Mesomycoplasma ovipneumoniae TaxID=29562 RepID=UPI00311CD211